MRSHEIVPTRIFTLKLDHVDGTCSLTNRAQSRAPCCVKTGEDMGDAAKE